jgi:hypothetical protein
MSAARQMGFQDINECPQLCKLANNYLKRTKNCMDDIDDFFANILDSESLYVKFIEELDKCILGYFAFHWDHATALISQVFIVPCDNWFSDFFFLAIYMELSFTFIYSKYYWYPKFTLEKKLILPCGWLFQKNIITYGLLLTFVLLI